MKINHAESLNKLLISYFATTVTTASLVFLLTGIRWCRSPG